LTGFSAGTLGCNQFFLDISKVFDELELRFPVQMVDARRDAVTHIWQLAGGNMN
jgi:hypothetical protein